MPIIDYKERAFKAEKKLMNSPDIPEQTKRVLQRFMIAYDVSHARKGIFLTKIRPLLTEFNPIESAVTDRDRINELFAKLRRHYSPARLDGNANRFSARFINQVSLLDGNAKSESLFRTL